MAAEEVATWATSGVYVMTNTRTGEQYVGSSLMCRVRWGDHIRRLRGRKHTSASLQAAWERDGAAAFTLEIVETVTDQGALREREEAWIARLHPKYNNTMPSDQKRVKPTPPPKPPKVRLHASGTRPRGLALRHLKAWRDLRLMAQAELAEKSGMSRSAITRAEKGDEPVNLANIRRIAKALKITTDELLYTSPEEGARDG
jgi:DNA-binding XRE family transcriptional regulator